MGTSASKAGEAQPREANGEPRYRERLYVSWWGWPLPLLGSVLLAAEIPMGFRAVPEWLPFAVLPVLAVLLMLSLGRVKVTVTGGDGPELRVGDAHIPLAFVGDVEVIGKDDKRKALGPESDPAAFVVHRGWIGPLLRLRLTDPADPTPYWLISTRKPERLAELVRGGTAREDSGYDEG
ncbi:DUF3093 domain-containing protein [Amycolatopsis minnesotensis]|uniref:DUF3093 domain-containing protein n=1 Tax=Amycolatopsis minnesotensis TaxID=337894 RepID=UPI0031E492B0